MGVYNAEAIVLRTRDFDEADKILVMLTREEGKIQAVAKGARRPRGRYAAAAQIFTQVKASLYHGRNLDTLSQVEIVESFRHLREDLLRMAYGSYICELMDEMLREKQRYESTYLLLLTTLHLLNEPDLPPEPTRRAYELKLFSILGFRPSFEECVACNKPLGPGPVVRFAPALGGVLCPTCPAEGEVVHRLSRGTLETMKRLLDGDIRKAYMVRIAADMAGEIDRAIADYIKVRTERPLKSKEFLDELRV
ncbi:MAG TPA: DNA repair protein RecO [Symbiobacteriaceae bacterium]|nr:DNA repair protein RecO [Symbiobacteriaceae bacterium]